MSLVITLFSLALLLGGIGILLNKKGREKELKSFSVCIVARNEENVLPGTLKSLESIDYPSELYEIILIDDCSKDRTWELFEEFASLRENVRTIRITEAEKTLPGKKEGLQRALEAARYEIILLTDADCTVSRDWLKDCSAYWDKDTKLLAGYAPEDYSHIMKRSSPLRKLILIFSRFSNLVTAGCYSATIGLGKPFSCHGRNLAVSKELLIRAGGYNSIGKDVSGDDKQVLNLLMKQPGKVRYSPVKNVVTHPETERFADQQKRRYGKIRMSSSLYFLLTLIVIGFYLYLPFRILIFRDYNGFLLYYASALLAWSMNLIKHRERFHPFDLIFIIVYPYYMIFYTVMGTGGGWKWKN